MNDYCLSSSYESFVPTQVLLSCRAVMEEEGEKKKRKRSWEEDGRPGSTHVKIEVGPGCIQSQSELDPICKVFRESQVLPTWFCIFLLLE